jgi:hypothetical protein
MAKVNGLNIPRIAINGKNILRVMCNGSEIWSGNGLPSGYTLLNYIQGNGNQYIDTGYKPKYNTKVIIELSDITGNGFLIGTRDTASGTSSAQYCIYKNSNGIRSDYFGTNKTISSPDVTSRGIVIKDANKLNFKGVEITNTKVSSGTCSYNLLLFALNDVGAVSQASLRGKFKMYYCQIYDNGELIRDYIPCKNPSGVCGLYDKVNKIFYGSASTTPFTGA